MSAIVRIPSQFQLPALHGFVRGVVHPHGYPISKEIYFDFSQLHFIDGAGLTVFCNTLEWLFRNNVKCFFQGFEGFRPSITYLDDCGFFREYLRKPLRTSAKARSTNVPLTKIKHAESFGWLELTLTPWLADVLGVKEGALGTIRTCAKEIFNNIIDHSNEEIGCAHVQHYPKINEVHITISDFGKGIPQNIRPIYGKMSDGEAVLLSTIDGVTTKSKPVNSGSGLSVLVDYVTRKRGSVAIYSCTARVIT